MRVALVHDYIKEYGGAERVLEALHEAFPQADVFTTVYLPDYLGPHRQRFQDWKIYTSWLQFIPGKAKLMSVFRLLSPFAFRSFDFSDYDVVIVSATGAYFPNAIRTKKALTSSGKPSSSLSKENQLKSKPVHICYCHTPPRYLYGYKTAREWKRNAVLRVVGEAMNHVLRIVDFNASKNVDLYIANSQEVQARIKKFYRREAVVVYPPVEISPRKKTEHTRNARSSENQMIRNAHLANLSNSRLFELSDYSKKYYLTGGRLARAKHVDLIIQACRELDVPLKIFGKGFAGYEEELKKLANSNYSSSKRTESKSSRRALPARTSNTIEFVGEVTDEEKYELMQKAKAFLFASEDEDFGITPVEAMAQGIPVIAYRSGGVKETVVAGKTGLFFEKLTVADLVRALKQFNSVTIDPKDCLKQAEKFSKQRFLKEISSCVASRVA